MPKNPEIIVKKKMPKIWLPTHDDTLRVLFRKNNLNDKQIGERMGFSEGSIERHRLELGLSRRYGEMEPKPKRPPYMKKPEPEPRPKHSTGINPDSHLARAKELLKGRLLEQHGAIYLDGKLVRFYLEIVTEANRVRKRSGIDQEGPSECRV